MTRTFRHWLVGFSVIALLAFGLPATTQAQQKTPRFEKADCKFGRISGRTVNCGYLTVPENRSKPNGKTIRLHVAVIKAATPTAADPVIYLEGGPGGYSLASAVDALDPRGGVFSSYAKKRDFIMFDQRGVGYSEPALDCPERTDAGYELLTQRLTWNEKKYFEDRAITLCHDRLVGQGIDLSAYNTAENAADVSDLITALGYKQYNLYGISYGTRLALTVMRDRPQGVRSVIIDGVVPLQADLYAKMPANADRAFKIFFQACLKKPLCNDAFPNLEKTFYDLVKKLNEDPVTISVKQPYTGKVFKVLVDGDIFINMLFGSMYSYSVVILPKIIATTYRGDYSYIERMLRGSTLKTEYDLSFGMYLSVQCAEEIAFETPQTLATADKAFPKLNQVFDMSRYYNLCQMWNVKAAPVVENKAVTSNIPTLILSGQYDPITPPSYGYRASQTLLKSFNFEFPGVGHGASVADNCPHQVALAFLDAPTKRPSIGCMSFMDEPEFVTR